MAHDDDDEDQNGSAVPPLELARSYAAYTVRALKQNAKLAVITSASLLALTAAAVAVWPRTFTCTTVLSAIDNKVLDGDRTNDTLKNAPELILGNENIAQIVKKTELTKRWEQTLSPLSRVKQAVMAQIRGELTEDAKREALIGMVQNSISVNSGWMATKMSVSADWHDPKIAADLARAALQSFLDARQVAEIATIEEYIQILEGHATTSARKSRRWLAKRKGSATANSPKHKITSTK
jgi:uncharacterized protein involved in exopolysaccharide biosynthesis